MITRIARKEITEMFRDNRFRWMSIITAVLLFISLLAGWKSYNDIQAQKSTAAKAERERWLKQEKKNPHSAAHYGIYAFKPQSALGAIDRGIEPFVGSSVWLEAHKQNEFIHRPAQDATATQRFGELSAGMILQILLPLFIVLLCFGTFSSERELGTLRLLLSMGVPGKNLAQGKILGICVALSLLLIPAAIIGSAIILMTSTDAHNFSRFMWMTLAYTLYLGVFVFISVAVSAVTRSGRMSLVILLSFWILNCLIAPRASADLASYLHPTPSAVEFRRALEEELGAPHDVAKLDEFKAALMKEYNVEKPEDLPVNINAIITQKSEEESYVIFDKYFYRVYDVFRSQDRFTQMSSLFAPILGIQPLSAALAGTDFEHHRHFITAAEDHRRVIQKIMNDDHAQHPEKEGERYMADEELWAKVPAFVYEAPTPGWSVQQAGTALGLLTCWFMFSFVAALRTSSNLKP